MIDVGNSLITQIMALIHVPFILDDMLMVRGHAANITMLMLMDVNIARIPGKKEPHLSE